ADSISVSLQLSQSSSAQALRSRRLLLLSLRSASADRSAPAAKAAFRADAPRVPAVPGSTPSRARASNVVVLRARYRAQPVTFLFDSRVATQRNVCRPHKRTRWQERVRKAATRPSAQSGSAPDYG